MLNIKPQSKHLKTRFDLWTTHQTKNILLKNNSSLYVHGEKSGKLLANLLQDAGANRNPFKNGGITSNPIEINNAFKNFYSRLYSSEFDGNKSWVSTFLNSPPILSIPPDLIKKIEAVITQAEIAQTISSMQSRKTMGPDRFPTEFSKSLSSQFAATLIESHQRASLLPSLMEEFIIYCEEREGPS